MTAPEQVKRLVEQFEAHRETYRSPGYHETQVRREFIDPLFEALGWDVFNRKGYSEAHKEVIHEDAIRVGGRTKAPDYCFRAGGGQRTFFVEAKKPAVDVGEAIDPAFQLRRYAWSAKLPLGILTDFEEFSVYDCRIRPAKTDKASTGRILYVKYTEYLDRWDELFDLLSPEAIRRGAIDRYLGSKRAAKGTAEVDAAFLAEIESWRDALARNLALRNEAISQRDLNFAVQRTIDRIIFLRICEDRGIEPYGTLQSLSNGANIYARLGELFRRADDRYNSGLFYFTREKGRRDPPDELTLRLTIDDRVLADILRDLYYPDSPYEFSVLPAEILGQVYEQFLGKVIRLTKGHQAKVEEKPEVKKAGGVYYTPSYIVDYIVRHTVGRLVEGKTPQQIGGLTATWKPSKTARPLAVLDPACGSGSFLLGAYQFLLDWHREWYENDGPEKHARAKQPRLYQSAKGGWRLTTAEKKRILLAHIHGVDIDSQAVEVTKLSLLLKVLEGESGETITNQLRLFHERALPDLSGNIKCGNSLIGPDFYKGRQKNLFDEEEMLRVNAFDWKAEFPEILKGRDPGFDAVFGNPPYVIVAGDSSSQEVADYLQQYAVAQYKMDLYHLFIQKGVDLLRKDGRFGYIVPNTWFTQQFTDQLRQYVLSHTAVTELVIFEHRVFSEADVHTALVFLRKEVPAPRHLVGIKRPTTVADASAIAETAEEYVRQREWAQSDGFRMETRLVGQLGALIQRLRQEYPSLMSVARASLGCQAYNRTKHTPEQIERRVFHSKKKLSSEYLPELAGRDVARYVIHRVRGQWVKYGPWLHDYRSMDWLTGPRILVREIPGPAPNRIQACFTTKTYCNYKTILNVNPTESTGLSMLYLTGLLNSRLLSFVYPYTSNKMLAKSFPRISVGDLRRLPVRDIDFKNKSDRARHDRMVALVETMLALHEELPRAKEPHRRTVLARRIDATDREIDQLVYELYGLSDKEIALVEGSGQ